MVPAAIGHRPVRLAPARARCATLRVAACLAGALLTIAHVAYAAPPGEDTNARPALRASTKKQASSLESENKALGQAILRQQLAPTPENERLLADEYANIGVLDAAFDHYEAVLRLEPHNVPALDGVARIWRDWGYPNLALPVAYRAVFWASESAPIQNTLGTVLLKLGEFDGARSHFERAQQLDPSAAYAVNNLCFLELQRGRPADAAPFCRDASALAPASAVVRNNLAVMLAASGDLNGAFDAFESGASTAVAAYNQGILLMASGQRAEAQEAFTRARAADPAFMPALARLKQLAAGGPGR